MLLKRPFFASGPAKLRGILATLDANVRHKDATRNILRVLDDSKPSLYQALLRNRLEPLPAKALTIKILNLFLARYHFQARSTKLFSSPYGIIVDPINNCQLACPGCVHSAHSKAQRLFDWPSGMLSEATFSDFMRQYGPYAIGTTLYNYGEPLLNPDTPKFIRIAKRYLTRTAISTNMCVKNFDAEAYVNSGLDFLTVSIDGATQQTYEKFRRKGDIESALSNVRNLMETRARMRKGTPVVSWQYLMFEHNEKEIDDALVLARRIGVDQFVLASPFGVEWDAPEIHASTRPGRVVSLRGNAEQRMAGNWNPFPLEIDREAVDREFQMPWSDRGVPSDAEGSRSPCHFLYESITMDARGRIMPCGGAPRPDADLVFGTAKAGVDLFNSEKYILARMSFSDPDRLPTGRGPHCAKCDWYEDQRNGHIGKSQLRQYFEAGGSGAFNPASLSILAGGA